MIMKSIFDIYKKKVFELGNRIFLKDDNGEITYKDSYEQVNRIAYMLYDMGVRDGSVVGIFLSNRIEYVLYLLAVNKLGATFLPVNSLCTIEELQEIIDWSRMIALVTEKRKDIKETNCSVIFVEDFEKYKLRSDVSLEGITRNSSVAAILLTSGTTGNYKGVVLEQETVFNCFEIISSASEYKEKMTSVIVSPLYHIYPLYNQVFPGIFLGHTMILHNFSQIDKLMECIEKNQVQLILAAPIIYSMVAMFDMRKKYGLNTLEIMSYSGAPMPKDVILYLKDNYPDIKLINSYGTTETGGTFAVLEAKYAVDKIQSVGKKSKRVDILIRQSNGICTRESNKKGEVLVKTKCMKSYMNADSSDKFFEGYICTGDYGYFDENGFIYLEGRIDDMIIVNGVNIHPSYVEKQFKNCQGVEEIIILSTETILGEQIVAYVKLKKGSLLKDVKQYANENIDKSLRPMNYIEVEKIPRSGAGKILRKELRECSKK